MEDRLAILHIVLCTLGIPEDEAFWWALICRSFRDAVIDEYPNLISGIRIHERHGHISGSHGVGEEPGRWIMAEMDARKSERTPLG